MCANIVDVISNNYAKSAMLRNHVQMYANTDWIFAVAAVAVEMRLFVLSALPQPMLGDSASKYQWRKVRHRPIQWQHRDPVDLYIQVPFKVA